MWCIGQKRQLRQVLPSSHFESSVFSCRFQMRFLVGESCSKNVHYSSKFLRFFLLSSSRAPRFSHGSLNLFSTGVLVHSQLCFSSCDTLFESRSKMQTRNVDQKKIFCSRNKLVRDSKPTSSTATKSIFPQTLIPPPRSKSLGAETVRNEEITKKDIFVGDEDEYKGREEWEEEEEQFYMDDDEEDSLQGSKNNRKTKKEKKVLRTARGIVDGRHRRGPAVVVRKSEIEKLDQMHVEVPQALHYKLHTMDIITEPIIRSIKTHTQLRIYAPSQESFDHAREYNELVVNIKNEELGTCFYLRVITLPPLLVKPEAQHEAPSILTKCDMKPFVPLDKSTGLTWELGAKRRSNKRGYCPFFLYHHPPPTPTYPPLTGAQRKAVDQIKKVLQLHFSTCVIEPIEGELACDVSLYAKYGALYEKAAIVAHQFNQDLDDILKVKKIQEFEHYGKQLHPVGKGSVSPLEPEEVALRMAAFLKSIVFSSHSCSSEDLHNAEDRNQDGSLRIILGIARTAVQAKLACDTEVAVVLQKHLERCSQYKQAEKDHLKLKKKKSGASSMPTSQLLPKDEQLICIRSFHKHFRTIEDEKQFIGSFELSQIPTVSVAFANFMKQVFNIERVSQILEKEEQLHFSLCRITFDYCIRMGFGRMRFPHEIHTPLFSAAGKHIDEKILQETANNSISLLNENRTSFRREAPRLVYKMNCRQTCALSSLMGQKAYGRLVSNKKFVQAAVEASLGPIEMLFENHCSAAALCLEDRRSYRRVTWEAVSFPHTTNPLIILKVVRQLAEKMAQRRVIDEFSEDDDSYSLFVRIFHLESYNLLPTSLEEGINAVVTAVKESCERRKENRFVIQRVTQLQSLKRPLKVKETKEEEKGKKIVTLPKKRNS